MSDKGTIDEIGRALDIPLDEVAHIKEMYSAYKDTIESTGKRIKEIEDMIHFDEIKQANKESEYYGLRRDYENKITERDKAIKQMNDLKDNQYRKLFYYFDGINGTPVSQSIHPAGIVVSPVTLWYERNVLYGRGSKMFICLVIII